MVSGVEKYAVREGESSETLTRHLYSSTEVSLVPSNIQDLLGAAYPQKKYQVSIYSVQGPLPRFFSIATTLSFPRMTAWNTTAR